MHPYINREVKCAFRWYESARLRHRNRTLPTDPDKPNGGTMTLPFPYCTLLPFQARCNADVTSITSWRMYNLAGAEVYNLDSQIPNLVLAQYANPDRTIVCLQEALIILALPTTEKAYEMQMVTNTGAILYSETFELLCGKPVYSMANSQLTSGTTNWGYGDWAGRLGDVITGAGVPPRDGLYDTERVANLTDNLLYTWNGTIWNSSTPVNGTYWSEGVGEQWYIFTGGAWASAVTPPILATPDAAGGITCWNGSYAAQWEYTPPETELPGFVLVSFTVFKGTPITGSIDVFAGSTHLGNFGNATNGLGQEFTVYLEAGETIRFVPSTSSFDGCLTPTNFQAIADGTECMNKLEWSNCGDLGNTAYTIGAGLFTNILYLREGGGSISGVVWEPTPLITVSPETNQRGDQIQTRVRKETNWRLELGGIPWHVMDAISEIPTVDTASIRVPWANNSDAILSPRIDVAWSENMYEADGTFTFQVDDATVNSGCCGNFDRPCPESCGVADGIYGVHDLVEGNTYLYDGGRIAVYCGLDCVNPVDELGFNSFTECPFGYAMTSDPDYGLMRWNGSAWVQMAEITSATGVDEDCEAILVVATMPSGYTGQLEGSVDGSTWTDLGVAASASQWADGVEVVPPLHTMYLRLNVLGYECSLGTSLRVPAPCACPHWVFSTNLAENCGSLPIAVTALFQPFAYDGGALLSMVALGETVQLWWRINGGAWTAVSDVQTTGAFYATNEITYSTAGDILEVRVLPVDRPWCSYSVSQEFSCPA